MFIGGFFINWKLCAAILECLNAVMGHISKSENATMKVVSDA